MIREIYEAAHVADEASLALIQLNAVLGRLNRAAQIYKNNIVRLNHGRARKVSFIHPSPRMSRNKIADMWRAACEKEAEWQS